MGKWLVVFDEKFVRLGRSIREKGHHFCNYFLFHTKFCYSYKSSVSLFVFTCRGDGRGLCLLTLSVATEQMSPTTYLYHPLSRARLQASPCLNCPTLFVGNLSDVLALREGCLLGLGVTHALFIRWRAVIDAAVGTWIFTVVAAKDLREPIEQDVTSVLLLAEWAWMCGYGPLLEQFDTVELSVDPFVPDVPRYLLFQAHTIEFALRNLITRPKYSQKESINFYFWSVRKMIKLTVKTAGSLSSSKCSTFKARQDYTDTNKRLAKRLKVSLLARLVDWLDAFRMWKAKEKSAYQSEKFFFWVFTDLWLLFLYGQLWRTRWRIPNFFIKHVVGLCRSHSHALFTELLSFFSACSLLEGWPGVHVRYQGIVEHHQWAVGFVESSAHRDPTFVTISAQNRNARFISLNVTEKSIALFQLFLRRLGHIHVFDLAKEYSVLPRHE